MKKPEYIPLKKYDKHLQNPFAPEAVDRLEVRKRTTLIHPTNREAIHQVQVIDTRTGEVTDAHTSFHKIEYVDEEQFIKLFRTELGALWDLPKPALRVFTYVMNALIINEDSIFFDPNECMEYTGYKAKKSVINGLCKLIEHGIIARSTIPYRYFINPMILFNGNRVTFARTYVKKRKRQGDESTIDMFEGTKQLEAPEDEQQASETDTAE